MSGTLRCLIIDDEPSAQQILRQYIGDAPGLTLADCCSDALEAMEFLKEHEVDLLFLDINMPKLSGISFLKSLKEPPAVILTTAYEEYALEGYELNVVDYLLKPFSFERFLKSVAKIENRQRQNTLSQSFLTVKADKKSYRVSFNDILLIESAGDYVTLHCRDRKLITYATMKNLEDTLPTNQFYRVHKSYIISVHHIEYLEGNSIKIGGKLVPIGTTYRHEIKTRILNQ